MNYKMYSKRGKQFWLNVFATSEAVQECRKFNAWPRGAIGVLWRLIDWR